MAATLRLTTAQALVRWMIAQRIVHEGAEQPVFAGVFAIFGHGNVAGLGEALQQVRATLPTLRAHNEQAMAHAAIAFAKAHRRRRMMACTTSIGPGATNLVTAAALAHVNRLPLLLLPGDVFASRRPDPVLQQLEDFGDGTASVNDCLRPVARLWDRITRPGQLLAALPQALSVLLDPADCGPVVLALPQDVQAEAWDWPIALFEPVVNRIARPRADAGAIAQCAQLLREARRPLIVAGGGVLYSEAAALLADFAAGHGIPVSETQAGKGVLAWDHPNNAGAIGVTGTDAANRLAAQADLVLAIGTRLQDFTTASHTLFAPDARFVAINPCRHDAIKRGALALRGDALATLGELGAALGAWRCDAQWQALALQESAAWNATVARVLREGPRERPSDAQVVGVVNAAAGDDTTLVCAAGGLPGELHRLWRASGPDAYHLEYGYSCMGYEIAGGLGVKLARPAREVIVMVGDGSYLMMNSEIATSVMLGLRLVIVLLDNRGFGCISRLQAACGGEAFNNLLPDDTAPRIDFVAHARALGALAEQAPDLDALAAALERARTAARTTVIVIETDPARTGGVGGAWWDVPVAEVSASERVRAARADYEKARGR